MQFIEKNIHGFPVIELEGKIMGDRKSVLFSDRLKQLIDSGKKNIILDFQKVRWMNSAGIGMILSCVKNLHKCGGDLYFVG